MRVALVAGRHERGRHRRGGARELRVHRQGRSASAGSTPSTDFVVTFDDAPSTFAENAYDAGYLVASVLEIANTTSDTGALVKAIPKTVRGTQVEAGDWAHIKATIDAEGTFDYRGASGECDFELTTSDIKPPYYHALWKISGGAITVYDYKIVATK